MEALSSEYGWLPSEIRKQSYLDIESYWKILDLKHRLKKAKEKSQKFKK